MNINELMLGDYVKYGNGFGVIKALMDNECLILVSCDENDELIWGTYDNIEGISLTHDILVKIGFETQPNIGYIIDDWDGNQIIYDSWNHVLRIIKDYKTCLDIETFNEMTVDELQHAFRLCRIEKKIVL